MLIPISLTLDGQSGQLQVCLCRQNQVSEAKTRHCHVMKLNFKKHEAEIWLMSCLIHAIICSIAFLS